MNPPICKECHCQPSARWDATGLQCYCTCHDLADAAPDLLAALKSLCAAYKAKDEVRTWKEGTQRHDLWNAALTAIARAEGQS